MAPGSKTKSSGEDLSELPRDEGFVYLDHAASTPPWEQALVVYAALARSDYANPSSRHSLGQQAREIYENGKEKFCDELGFHDGIFIHHASATEANNQVLSSFLSDSVGHVFIGSDVHASLSWVAEAYPERCSWIPLSPEGEYFLPEPKGRSLFLLNLVSQDIGTIHETDSWSKLFGNSEVHLHLDAVQAVGKIPLNFDELPFHSLSFSSHKFGGIKGSAGLLLRDREVRPLLRGGTQEHALRAGTENVSALLGSLEAFHLTRKLYRDSEGHLQKMRRFLKERLVEFPHRHILNEPERGVPWIINLSFPGYLGTELVAGLSRFNIGVSTSSACHQDVQTPPRAVSALGRNQSEALGSIRLSLHPHHTLSQIERFLTSLKECLDSLDQSSS